MNDARRLITFLILLFLAIALQVRSGEWFGWHIDIVLPVLVIAACWITTFYEVLLTLVAVLFMNWHPGIAPELIFFALFPITISLLGPYIPWRRTVTVIAGTAIGIVTFYLIAGGSGVIAWHGFLWKDVLVSTFISFLFSRLIRSLYGTKGARARGALYELPR